MNGFAFQKNCRFEQDGAVYLVQRVNPDKSVVAERITDGQVCCKAVGDLLESFTAGTLHFLDLAGNDEEQVQYVRPIDDLNDTTKRELDRRMAYVSAVREVAPHVLTPQTIMPICDQVARSMEDHAPPSFITLYRWVSSTARYGDFRALIPRYDRRGPRRPRQDPHVIELFEEAADRAFTQTPQATVKLVREEFKALIAQENSLRAAPFQYKVPSEATCYRMFERLDQFEKAVWREGKRIAVRKFKLVGTGTTTTRILERVEIDHTPLDLFLIDEKTKLPLGRPTLTIVLDHYSRMPLGYHLGFNAPSAAAVLAALRHAILPKKKRASTIGLEVYTEWPCFGKPGTAVVDNGLEFHGRPIELFAFNLRIHIQYCPKKEPQFKGTVERYLKEINYSCAHMLPGTSFARYFQRGDYDPEKHAVLTLTEFREIFEKWLLDVYANKIHRSLNTTPLEQWKKGAEAHPPTLPKSVDKLMADVGIPCRRSLRHDGITLHGLHYSGDCLAPILSRFGPGVRVTVIYDSSDLGTIRVCEPESNEILHVVYANHFEYANGLMLDQHLLIRRELIQQGRSASDPDAMSRELKAIRDKVAELAMSRKHSKRRLAARLAGTPKQAVESDPPSQGNHKHGRQPVVVSDSLSNLSSGLEKPRLPTFQMRRPEVV